MSCKLRFAKSRDQKKFFGHVFDLLADVQLGDIDPDRR